MNQNKIQSYNLPEDDEEQYSDSQHQEDQEQNEDEDGDEQEPKYPHMAQSQKNSTKNNLLSSNEYFSKSQIQSHQEQPGGTSGGGHVTRGSGSGQQVNIQIENYGSQQINPPRNLQIAGNTKSSYRYTANKQASQNYRPQSAKPYLNRSENTNQAMPIYMQNNFYGTRHQTMQQNLNDPNLFRRQQYQQRLVKQNIGGPYIATIKDAQNFNKQQKQANYNLTQLKRPLSGKQNKKLIKTSQTPSRKISEEIYVGLNQNQDPDQMYKACISMKQEVNQFAIQNQHLRTQMQVINVFSFLYIHPQIQKELAQRDRMIDDLLQTGQLSYTKANTDSILTIKLKQHVRELQQVLKEREAELDVIKKNLRSTRLEELEVSYKEAINEGLRLKTLIDGLLQQRYQDNRKQDEIQRDGMIVQLKTQLNEMINEKQGLIGYIAAKDKELQIWKSRYEKEFGNKKKAGSPSKNNSEVQFYKQKCEDIQKKYDSLLFKNSQLHSKNQNLQEQAIPSIKALPSQTAPQLTQQASLKNDQVVSKLKEQVKEYERKQSEMEYNIQELEDEKKQFEQEIQKMKQELTFSKSQYEAKIKLLSDQTGNSMQQILKEQQELNQQVDKYKKQIDSQKKEMDSLMVKYEELQAKYQSNENKLQSQLKLIDKDEKQNKDLKEEMDKIRKEYEIQIREMEKDLISKNSEIKSLKNEKEIQLNITNNDIKNLQKKVQDLQKEKEELTKQLSSHFQSIANAQQKPENPMVQPQPQKQQKQEQSSQVLTQQQKKPEVQQQSVPEKKAVEYRELIKEEWVKKYFVQMKRALQIARISKEDMLNYLFDQGQNQREETSIKELQTIILTKFMIEKDGCMALSRFIIESQNHIDTSVNKVEFDVNKTMMNRKIVKFISEKIVGQYEVFTEQEDQHYLKKMRELAQDHYQSLESQLYLYDEESTGLITPEDLTEGLEIIDAGKDKKACECFIIQMLRRNNKSNEQVKISHVLESLYPKQVKKLSSTNNNEIKPSIQSQSSIKENQSLKDQQSIKIHTQISKQSNPKSDYPKEFDNDKDDINEDIEDNYEDENYEQEQIANNEEYRQSKSDYENEYGQGQDMDNNTQEENNEQEMELADYALRTIAQYLNENQISLRDFLIEQIHDKHVAFENNEDTQYSVDKTMEVVTDTHFFAVFEPLELSDEHKIALLKIFGKQADEKDDIFMLYQDIEHALQSYGYIDQLAKPQGTKNFNLGSLDQKSIRIINRLIEYMDQNGMETIQDLVGEENIYSKSIKNRSLTSKAKEFQFEFVRKRVFFKYLVNIGIRKNSHPYRNLVQFLAIDSKIYNKGLLVIKLNKLFKIFRTNQYYKSVGMKKKLGKDEVEMIDVYPEEDEEDDAESNDNDFIENEFIEDQMIHEYSKSCISDQEDY